MCKIDRQKEALNMTDMVDFTLDTIIYTKIISKQCEASMLDKALSFLHKMRANSCIPNVATYNTLLEIFHKVGQLTMCNKNSFQMMYVGFCPNASIFNSLI
jgi:pentatricopeptide repeat protein